MDMLDEIRDLEPELVAALKDMSEDFRKDISTEFIFRVRYHDDEVAIVLKGHLLIEYLLNRIIEKKCKAPRKILDDPRNYPFSVKLQLVYSMGLLPEYLHDNIVRVNRLRNKLAHNLSFDIDSNQMAVTTSEGKTINVRPKRRSYPERQYLRLLCHSCLTGLRSHMLRKLRVDPRYLEQSSLW